MGAFRLGSPIFQACTLRKFDGHLQTSSNDPRNPATNDVGMRVLFQNYVGSLEKITLGKYICLKKSGSSGDDAFPFVQWKVVPNSKAGFPLPWKIQRKKETLHVNKNKFQAK